MTVEGRRPYTLTLFVSFFPPPVGLTPFCHLRSVFFRRTVQETLLRGERRRPLRDTLPLSSHPTRPRPSPGQFILVYSYFTLTLHPAGMTGGGPNVCGRQESWSPVLTQ